MGDFWPGNAIVSIDGDRLKHISVIDWELGKPGLPAVEVGKFCVEMHLLQRFDVAARGSTTQILSTFLKIYAQLFKPDICMCRDVLVHLGTHLVVWTPRLPWGDKSSTRNVVEEGFQFLTGAHSESKDWLRGSIVGTLVQDLLLQHA